MLLAVMVIVQVHVTKLLEINIGQITLPPIAAVKPQEIK